MSCNKTTQLPHTILNCNKTMDGSFVQLNCTEKEPITNEANVSYMCLHMQNVPTQENLPKKPSAGHPSSTPAGQPNNHAKHTSGGGSLTSTFTLLIFTFLLSLKPRA